MWGEPFSWGVALRKAPHGAASGRDSDTEKEGLGALGFRGGEAKAAGAPPGQAVPGDRIAAAPGRAGRTHRASPGPFFLWLGAAPKAGLTSQGPSQQRGQPPTPDPISKGNRRLPGISETVSSLHTHSPPPRPRSNTSVLLSGDSQPHPPSTRHPGQKPGVSFDASLPDPH